MASRRTAGPAAGGPQPTPGSAAEAGPDADPEQVARTILLRRLTAAPRTRAQLADDLAARGVPDDVAGRVLDRFTEVGLVDDAAFAEAWVRSRHEGRGLARSALAVELRRRGVPADDARAALATVTDVDEQRRAAELVVRRLPALAGLPPAVRCRRLVAMLARKGYPPGLAAAVVRSALAIDGTDPSDGTDGGP